MKEQWCNASNAENARALADPEDGLEQRLVQNVLTTVARNVQEIKCPTQMREKVMEYDSDMCARANRRR